MRSRWLGTSVAVAGLVVGLAACPDDEAERQTATLPPILTTTSTTTIPPSTTRPQRFYEVQEGDTLTEIADQFGVPILSIMELNAIPDQNAIYAGQLLELPDPAIFSGTTPASPSQTTSAP
jgi:LysM repeat protein